MKKLSFRHLAICFIIALCVCSCRFNDADIIYTPWYQYNYYLTNNTDAVITFYFAQKDHSSSLPPKEQIVVLAPSTSGKINDYMWRTGYQKDSTMTELPAIDPYKESTTILWNPKEMDSNTTTTTYLLIGDKKREFDLESDKLPFYTKNYRIKIEQDTIFNFYFSIDSAFVQTLK